MTRIRTDDEAIEAVKKALVDYADKVGSTASAAAREMAMITDEVGRFLVECERFIGELTRSIEILRGVEDPDYDLIREKEHRLAVWRRKSYDARRLQSSLARDHDTFRGQQRRYANAIEPLADLGAKRMRNARDDVVAYEKSQRIQARRATRSWNALGAAAVSSALASGTPDSTVNSVSWGGTDSLPTASSDSSNAIIAAHDPATGRFAVAGEVVVDGLPDGMVLAPLSQCVDEGRVSSPMSFNIGKGSADDLTWAVQSLYSDVLPRMASGGDIEQRLQDTDVGRGNSGNRSLHSTYSGFFRDAPVRLTELGDGTYEVVNGAHRIWVAQKLGVTHLPAVVRRRSL